MSDLKSEPTPPNTQLSQGLKWNTLFLISRRYLLIALPSYIFWTPIFLRVENAIQAIGLKYFKVGEEDSWFVIFYLSVRIATVIEHSLLYVITFIFYLKDFSEMNSESIHLLHILAFCMIRFIILVWWLPFYCIVKIFLLVNRDFVLISTTKSYKRNSQDGINSAENNNGRILILSLDLVTRTHLCYVFYILAFSIIDPILLESSRGYVANFVEAPWYYFNFKSKFNLWYLIFPVLFTISSVTALIWSIKRPWFGVALRLKEQPSTKEK